MKPTKQCQESDRRSSRGGFSLVEVVVSMVVLTYGLLGMAGTTMYYVREVAIADLATKRTVAARSTLERARALPFDTVGVGVDTVGGYELGWSATKTSPRTKLIRVIVTGPGVVSSPGGPVMVANAVDTVDFRAYRP